MNINQRKKRMRTLLEVLLDAAEVTMEDARKTVKEAVLMEDDTAKCIKTKKNIHIVFCPETKEKYGYGNTRNRAWEDAAYWLVTGNHL